MSSGVGNFGSRDWHESFAGRGIVYDLAHVALNATDAAERERAVVALGKSNDPRAVRPLVVLLKDEDPNIRLGAIDALGQIRSGRSVDDLIGKLKDKNEDIAIRRRVVFALAAIRSTGAVRGLVEFVADEDEDAGLRSCAERLLS
jgi:HEAT repeat protein